ncbi:phosphatidyl synthase [Coprinopsis sp. MPI-PUGE-AT-0042]|nr:phosphatidyl synthase [Coprinopsis sp. MPI-PUGE-AT-0042]
MLVAVASSASRASCLRVRLTATIATRAFSALPSPSPLLSRCQRRRLDALFSSAKRIQRLEFSTSARHFQAPEKNPIPPPEPQQDGGSSKLAKRENIYTIPNALTVSRIISCPILGWAILDGNYTFATGLLLYAGLTDWVDGYLARNYNMSSVLGTVLDPAADKLLMTTLVVTLTMQDMVPLPLAVIILGRDVALSGWALWVRYSTLPEPKTWSRYWDFGLPSAEVKPTTVSKVNTALQLLLMGSTTISPLLPFSTLLYLQGLQWTVATTTIWSGFQYFVGGGFKDLSKGSKGR